MDLLKWTVPKLIVLCILVCTQWTREGSSTLTIIQGRVATDPEFIPVVGIATVEITGGIHQPGYYFDCVTDRTNASGLRWTRASTINRFEVKDAAGPSGIRLDTLDIRSDDLDIYTCSDRYSDDIMNLNITDLNPAILAANETVIVLQGQSAELEVYVSGYPVPTESDISWRRPDGSLISSSDEGVTFQEGGRKIILSNVQANQAGLYRCSVTISSMMSASTELRLQVNVPPEIVSQPQVVIDALEWSEVRLTCSARGIPVPVIQWEREGGVQLPVGNQISTSMDGNTNTSSLMLSKVRYIDRGRYRCLARNLNTTPIASQYADVRVTPSLELRVAALPRIVEDLYIVEEEESYVSLECFGTGTLEWTRSTGEDISSDESENIYQIYNQRRDVLTLVIRNFTSLTTGVYTCMTNLTDAHNNPITASLLITSSNPAVVIRSRIQYVLRGNSSTLEARVYSLPFNMTVLRWYHEERLIDTANEPSYTASSNGDIYSLQVNSVSETELGKYTVVVSLNGLNATDSVRLRFPEPPSANVTPSSVTVNVGEEVRLRCVAEGSGALNVTWTMIDGRPLPVGVQENGNEIFIATASSSHSGTYVCSVSNLASTSQDEAIISVLYPPTVVLTHNQMNSTSEQPFYFVFDQGAPGPTIVCSADGSLPLTIRWVQQNGRGLPHGLFQTVQPNGDVQLRWQRPMEFTDSGSYICQASSSNGNSFATLQVLVQIDPYISSIYPYNSQTREHSQTFAYTVPLNHVGSTLVCVVKGWPAPEVEWYKNGIPLSTNDGVVSETVPMFATVSAKLTWTRYFRSSDEGSYECVVHKPNTVVPVASQAVQLISRNSTQTESPMTCSVQQQSIFFQIRVLGTNCASWNEQQIADEFHNELLSIIGTECSCQIDENELQVLGSPQCSTKVTGAAVFRGQIETNSSEKTEEIFCSFFSWQQRSPLIRINNQFRQVDSSCSLEASDSLNSEECVTPSSTVFGATQIAAILGAFASLLFILIVVLLTSCSAYYCYNRRKHLRVNTRVYDHTNDHTYSRTELFPRGSHNGVSPIRNNSSAGAYSTLSPGGESDSPLRFNERISLNRIHSDSGENMNAADRVDSTVQEQSMSMPPKAYESPTCSQENLTFSGNNSEARNRRHTSSTSGYNSSTLVSPVRTIHAHHNSLSSANDSRSARNPWNDYEDTFFPDSSSSFHDSPTIPDRLRGPESQRTSRGTAATSFDRLRENDSPRGSPESPSPCVMKQTLMAQFQSADNMADPGNRESSFSEAPPPYSSRPSSQAAAMYADFDNSSMIDNTAYEDANNHHHQRPWYQESDLSTQSRNSRSINTPPGTNTSTHQPIRPYAMIHNEHIPYDSNPLHNRTSGTTILNTSNTPNSRQLGRATISTLC